MVYRHNISELWSLSWILYKGLTLQCECYFCVDLEMTVEREGKLNCPNYESSVKINCTCTFPTPTKVRMLRGHMLC